MILNQSHGGIYMVGLQESMGDGSEGLSLSLQATPASALDLVSPMSKVAQELADVCLDLGLGPKARVGRHLFADPAPDGRGNTGPGDQARHRLPNDQAPVPRM